MRPLILALGLLTLASARADNLPLNPAVTQVTIGQTICVIGWTKTARPPAAQTALVKAGLLREFGIPQEQAVGFELDHRIPLALGGAPAAPRNLELQPWEEAVQKDHVEACLARAVCAGEISLDEARRRIWTNWPRVGVDCEGHQ